MKVMKIVSLLILIWLSSCNNNGGQNEPSDTRTREMYKEIISEDESEDGEYSDGTWCADVEYYNPNTGTNNTYNLDVEVLDGELVEISWPNGGWLDESHFLAEDITDGECSFTSDKGYEYRVTLNTKGGCRISDGYQLQQDIQQDDKAITCPKCGEEKAEYDDVCDDCQLVAQTCPKCYGYKMEWERICSSCQDEIDDNQRKLEEEDF